MVYAKTTKMAMMTARAATDILDRQSCYGYFEDFLKKFPTFNGSQTLLFEKTSTIFLVMVVMMVMLLFGH